jgi:hypothetical protein
MWLNLKKKKTKRQNEGRALKLYLLGGKTKMERKYTIVLCCLALLFLGSMCLAQPCGTPWPKHSGSYRAHYYINAPNSTGPNGQGDSPLELYLGTEIPTGINVTGLNMDIHDFGGGTGQTFKAMEARLSDGNTLIPCPIWDTPSRLAEITPVPYVSNWSFINQYCFDTPFAWTGVDAFACVQYTPGQNILSTGCPLLAADNGGNPLYGYFYSGSANRCFGPVYNNWWMSFCGLEPPPPVEVDVVLTNTKYLADVDDHPMCKGTGLKIVLHLINNAGMLYGPVDLNMWVRAGMNGYDGFSGTGLDLLDALSSGFKSSPLQLAVPPGSLGGGVKMDKLLGFLLEYSFSAYTFEVQLTDVPYGGTVNDVVEEDAQFNPLGCIDDNGTEVAWYLQYPTQWGDGFGKKFDKNEMPSGEFCINYVDHCVWDYSGANPLLIEATIRTESPIPFTPDFTPAGLLGTFDPTISPCCPLQRKQVYDYPAGNTDICFTAPPSGNIYAVYGFDPLAWGPHAAGSTTAGWHHKPFNHTILNWGSGVWPPADAWSRQAGSEAIIRLVYGADQPLDGDFESSGELAAAKPTFAKMKK